MSCVLYQILAALFQHGFWQMSNPRGSRRWLQYLGPSLAVWDMGWALDFWIQSGLAPLLWATEKKQVDEGTLSHSPLSFSISLFLCPLPFSFCILLSSSFCLFLKDYQRLLFENCVPIWSCLPISSIADKLSLERKSYRDGDKDS